MFFFENVVPNKDNIILIFNINQSFLATMYNIVTCSMLVSDIVFSIIFQ